MDSSPAGSQREQRRLAEPLRSLGAAYLRGIMALVLSWLPASAEVVINEIHYAPDVETEAVEFIELYNRGASAADLSGWAFAEGVQFAFPPGTVVAAGGYVVIAQNPAACKAKFGLDALGPWAGRLSNQGERIALADAEGKVADAVEYQLGFPWPTVGDPPGYSIELVNPGADNDLGGHWRASFTGGGSQQTTLLLEAGAEWRYFKGMSAPPGTWRELTFDDAAWSRGEAPVGYDPYVRMGTVLADMRYGYMDFFLRRTFVVTNVAAITTLALEALYDDGFKLWINGTNVFNLGMPGGEVPYDQAALPVRENDTYEKQEFAVAAGWLRDGTNVIAVQVANVNLGGSSDAFFDGRLRAVVGPTGRGPTPGRLNSTYTAKIPPAIRQVEHQPRQPLGGQPVVVSAKVTSVLGVGSVVLQYQAVEPGSYVELTDAAYATSWTTATLNDAGGDGDRQAGDDIYTVTLPGALQGHRRLIRYRLLATDRTGLAVSAPYADDPQPNFAYFCYDGVPAWTGALRPGAAGDPGRSFTVNREEMNRLPVYHLVAKKAAVESCTWYDRSHGDEYYWIGTLVYDGVVYDHVRFRPRGGVWRYAMGKNMWKFDFNRGHDFQPRDDWGRKLGTPWTKLNLGACIQQGDYLHRGEQGMFESVGFRLFRLVGQPAMHTAFVQFRIVDEAPEAAPGTQYAGDFWGLYLAIEQPDGRFLQEHGLADGNLYKMEGGGGDPNNIGPLGPIDYSDLNRFMSGYNSNPSEAWWRTNLSLRPYFGYQAILQAIHHYDIADGKNYFYHRDPFTGIWTVLPWDLDLTWADNMYRGGQTGGDEPFKSRVLSDFSSNPTYPGIAREFRNRVREIRDLLWNPDEAFRLLNEHARLVRGTNAASIIDADRAQWDYNPLMNDGGIVNLGKAGWGRFYQQGTPTRDFAGMVQLMKNYVGYRATNAGFSLDRMADEPQRPPRPTLTYSGPAGYPANRLRFQTTPFSGSQFGSVHWRVAEISRPDHPAYDPTEPEHYEITPTWESAGIMSPTLDFTFPAGVTKVGHLYRARVRFADALGRASHWSAPVEFTAGPPDTTELLLQHLRISELMYNPPAGGEFEFIELHNTSPDATLELGGVTFTAGVQYTFPSGVSLAPGAHALVVQAAAVGDFAAFRAHYGLATAVGVFGPYAGALANDGETLTLKTTGGGTTVFSFAYGDGRGWPVAADGAGHSLVPAPDALGGQSLGWLDYAGNWRASAFIRGSPGRSDPQPARALVISEIMAHTHDSAPEHPEHDSNDWIELQNISASDLNLAGWYLSDDAADLRKFALPPVIVPPGGFASYDEVTGFHATAGTGFGLSGAGEQLFLSHLPGAGQDRVVDAGSFKGQELDYSWGRVSEGEPYWTRQVPSRGGPVQGAAPVTVVINEIMYRPFDLQEGTGRSDNVQDEFVELCNPHPEAVALCDTNGVWRLDGGIAFSFPTNTFIPADGCVLVVPFDPASAADLARFRQRYGIVDPDLPIVGPYAGKLANTSDRLALEKPLQPDRPGEAFAWVIVDEVIYSSGWPWPQAPTEGRGQSLQRLSGGASGNRPENWRSAWPTAGLRSLTGSRADFDGDGLPDWWEAAVGLDPTDASTVNGGNGDPDGDGLANDREFRSGGDPLRTTICFLTIRPIGNRVELEFNQPAQSTLRLEAAGAVETEIWEAVASFPGQPSARLLRVTDGPDGAPAHRFYRLLAP